MKNNLLVRGSPVGIIKGILFDKDGTLSNSEDHLIKIASYRIRQVISLLKKEKIHPQKLSKVEKLLKITYGLTPKGLKPDGSIAVASREQNLITTSTICCLIGESWPNALALAQEAFENADHFYDKNNANHPSSPILNGFLEFQQRVINKGIICALISNDNNNGIENFLNKNNLKAEISHYWSCDNKPIKPNPNAAKGLCKILDLNPEECALIGDADSDLIMAKKAGISLAIGYTGGWRTPPKLNYYDHLIQHWDEISIE